MPSAPTTGLHNKTIGVVGARLNSSRLPGKHLLDLADKPLIERIFERLELTPELDHIILATTADEYNQPLIKWALDTNRKVFAYDGDVNDLTARVNAVAQMYDAEIIAFFCGDSPLIEPDAVSRILRTYAKSPDADAVAFQRKEGFDYVYGGIQIYRRKIWDWIAAESVS